MADFLPNILSFFALAVSVVALGHSILVSRRQRAKEDQKHALAVQVAVETKEVEVLGATAVRRIEGYELIIRNDGESAISLRGVDFAFGSKMVSDPRRFERWEMRRVSGSRYSSSLVRPGTEISIPVDHAQMNSGANFLGPVATVVDVNGIVWERTTWGVRQIEDLQALRWGRLEPWFERRSWWACLDSRLFDRAVRKANRRPSRVPWEMRLIERTWGYKLARKDSSALPWNAPEVWSYPGLLGEDDGAEPFTNQLIEELRPLAEAAVTKLEGAPRESWEPASLGEPNPLDLTSLLTSNVKTEDEKEQASLRKLLVHGYDVESLEVAILVARLHKRVWKVQIDAAAKQLVSEEDFQGLDPRFRRAKVAARLRHIDPCCVSRRLIRRIDEKVAGLLDEGWSPNSAASVVSDPGL